jgi:hypothetical protein
LCNTCCDTGPRFFRSHPNNRPIQSPLTSRKGMWMIYSILDPHGASISLLYMYIRIVTWTCIIIISILVAYTCSDGPCKSGTCTDTDHGGKCTCGSKHTGRYCETGNILSRPPLTIRLSEDNIARQEVCDPFVRKSKSMIKTI